MSTDMLGTVLVIDDEPAIAALVDAALCDEGYAVLITTPDDSPLEAIRRESPDLVLLDATPHGQQLADLVAKAREIAPGLRITLFTALSPSEAEALQTSLPGVGLLLKPFDVDGLIAYVRQALRDGEQGTEAADC